MITVRVNGEDRDAPEDATLLALMQSLGIKPELVAAQHNDRIIERAHLGDVALSDGDTVELIRIVGGG